MSPFDEILGESRVMKTLLESVGVVVDRLAHVTTLPPVLIVGESGTGKRLVAKALHNASARRGGPIVDLEIGGVHDCFLESMLFGFERNAFTGAQRRAQGVLQQAHGGTLCLKDIDRLPLPLARMVLAVITDRTVRRMKGSEVEPADIWLIGTSHTRAAVFHPFRPIVLTTPALRERGDDVLLLARHCLAEFGSLYGVPAKTLSPSAEAVLRGHDWRRGNMWELRHEMERGTILIEPQQLEPEDLALSPARP